MRQNQKDPSIEARLKHTGMALMFIIGLCALVLGWPRGTQERAHAQAVPIAPSGGSDVVGRYTFADLADGVLPSVVTVYVKRDVKASLSPQQREQLERFRQFFQNPQFRQFFGPEMGPGEDEENPFIAQTSGSGVVISADGYIITNWHVVGDLGDKTDLRVVFSDETEIKGDDIKLVYSHPVTDLAILKVNRTDLRPIHWGNSDSLRIGERVAAIGSPLDLRATITQGIICAKHRDVDASAGDMLQTDAVINPGSSGGALVNLDGELVGINRLITTNSGRWQGYGFAIPANDARRFADEVIRSGKVSYGYIGISMGNEREDTPRMREALGLEKDQDGVLVTAVTKDSPAEKAGLKVGDFIIRADKEEIKDSGGLLRLVMRKRVGDKLALTVLRPNADGKVDKESLDLLVAERPSQNDLEAQLRGGGMRPAQTPTPKPEGSLPLGLAVESYEQDGTRGLRVREVEPDSPAARAGINEGDILLSMNRMDLRNPEDLERAIKSKKLAGRQHVVQLIQNGRLTLATIDEK